MTTSYKSIIPVLATGLLVACGGGGSDQAATDPITVPLTGSVSSPGGTIAFNNTTGVEQILAQILFGKMANSTITGVSPVGAGVTIELIEVDADGVKVGDTLASTTTDADGNYTLEAPEGFVASSQYVIRATGTTETLDTRVTSDSNDVDPITDAVSDLITTTASDLSTISVDEITEIESALDSISKEVDLSGSATAEEVSEALKAAAANDEVVSSQLSNVTAAESICGNVKDASNNNLENIRIVVRDFGEWVTRAKTKTDANGDYCVNVAAGDYIVGALNFTGTSTAASEWWSSTGDKYGLIDAEKVTVAATSNATANFNLEAGVRIQGTVTEAVGATALEGVKVTIRQYQNFFPLGAQKSKVDGSYRINVIPGSYTVEAINRTIAPYASEIYDGATGTGERFNVPPIDTTTVGSTSTIDFALSEGRKVFGQILDSPAGNPVAGIRILVNFTGTRGPSFRLRTNKEGQYRVWLSPDIYTIASYGQTQSPVDLTASNKEVSFDTQVGALTAVIKDSSDNPVSQAKLWLTDTSNQAVSISQEVSSSDGSVTLYSPTTGNHRIYVRIDEDRTYGSTVWDGQTEILSGTQVALTTGITTPLGSDIVLPDAGLLVVNVTSDGITPVANYRVQIRSVGTTGADRFITHRTLGDGSFKLSLPAGTYDAIVLIDDSKTCGSVQITKNATTTVDCDLSSL